MRIKLGVCLLVCSFAVLIPGITKPMITLTGTLDKAQIITVGKAIIADSPNVPAMLSGIAENFMDALNAEGEIEAYSKTRSILGTVGELFDSKNYLVGILIITFSVIVPVSKGLLILTSLMVQQVKVRGRILNISGMISKWSMADVFVVAIIVAYMAANASQGMGEMFSLQARFEEGFYYFTGYCLLSILSAQLITTPEVNT